MPLDALTEAERETVRRCLHAAATGPFFDDDDEFHTLFGVTRDALRAVLAQWPNVDEADETVYLSITNALGNLAGYPHGFNLVQRVGADADQLLRLLKRWRAD